MAEKATLRLEGRDYVILPKEEYLQLIGGRGQQNDALAFAQVELGKDLRKARELKGFTQAQLAEKIGKSQAAVSAAEAGRIRVSEDYARSVLEACGLRPDWTRRDAAVYSFLAWARTAQRGPFKYPLDEGDETPTILRAAIEHGARGWTFETNFGKGKGSFDTAGEAKRAATAAIAKNLGAKLP